MRRAPRVALALALAGLAAPAGAQAPPGPGAAGATPTLAFVKGLASGRPAVWVAGASGGAARRLTAGFHPVVSPDGSQVAFLRGGPQPQLRLVAAAGGAERVLARSVWSFDAIRFSPDGTKLSVVSGPELGPYALRIVDLATGTSRVLQRGYFSGASFDPAGQGLVWARAARERFPFGADLYRADLAGGPVVRLTSDRNAQDPVWGPQRIVYSRGRRAPRRHDYDKLDLYTLAPDGSDRARLTNARVPFLLAGLTATAWSADGSRLLAEYGGQDTSEAWRVDPATGRATDVTGAFDGVIGWGLSSDGAAVLATTGGFDSPYGDVVAIDWATGGRTLLARRAATPSWNR